MRRTGYIAAIGTSVLALLAALSLPAPARAAEHITLANGFDLVCNHHQLVDGKVRIYLKASDPDYVELSPEAIAGYETVPDPIPADPKASPTADRQFAPAVTASAVRLPERLTPEDLHQLLAKPSIEHNVDEDLLASVVKAESGGYTHAISRTGARGLMQLMPGTAHQLGVADSFAPDQNVRGGTAYLDALLTRYHDNIALALAAYNAGPQAVDRYHGIPPYRETQAYVARVVHEFNRRVLARRNSASANAIQAAVHTPQAETATSGNAGTGSD
jgi:soluble lytic murein transglycosylase-like protein